MKFLDSWDFAEYLLEEEAVNMAKEKEAEAKAERAKLARAREKGEEQPVEPSLVIRKYRE